MSLHIKVFIGCGLGAAIIIKIVQMLDSVLSADAMILVIVFGLFGAIGAFITVMAEHLKNI